MLQTLKKFYDIFLLRHIFFLFLEIKASIIHRNKYYSKHRFNILQRLILILFIPYYNFFKSKFVKRKTVIFENKFSKKLDEQGYVILPKINIDELKFVKIEIDPNQIMSNNKIDYSLGLEFARKQGFHDIAKDYIKEEKCNFKIVSWNTLPFKKSFGTTTWHQDRDGYKIVKFFIYLSDTDQDTGPHRFAVGSHKKKYLRFIPLFRFDDAEVKKYYKEIMEFCGEKGSCFAEITSGLHRGVPPTSKARSILQFEYYTGPLKWDENAITLNLS